MYLMKDAPRKTFERDQATTDLVAEIIRNVQTNGDRELLALTEKFDHVTMDTVRISEAQIRAAYTQVEPETIEAIRAAAAQIRFFAEKQLECLRPLTTATPVPGVTLGHRLIPVETVGAYVPAGRYPLPSSALMLAIPAKVAGVKTVVACSPVSKGYDTIPPAVRVALDIAGVDDIYCTGGAQAVAAMAYGTESVKKVDLIAGPGNRFVVEAKRQVMGSVGIDSLAGPSEVLILADELANPDFTAADLLAQSEHDLNARSTLITTSKEFAQKVLDSLEAMAPTLSTGETALQSWNDNGMILIADSMDEAKNRIAKQGIAQTRRRKRIDFPPTNPPESTSLLPGNPCSTASDLGKIQMSPRAISQHEARVGKPLIGNSEKRPKFIFHISAGTRSASSPSLP